MLEAVKTFVKRTPLSRPIRALIALSERRHMDPDTFRETRDDQAMTSLFNEVLSTASSCIDVGANRGRLLARMLERAPKGRHHAFEPIPEMAARLRERFPGVTVHESAVSDQAGTTTFYHVVSVPSLSGLRRQDHSQLRGAEVEEISVRLSRLDDILPSDLTVSLIKIDVEGAELQVLRGGLATIRRCRPVIVFEYANVHGNLFGTTPEMIHDFLTNECSYHVHSLLGRQPRLDRRGFSRLCNAASTTPRFEENFVAFPESTGKR